MASPTPCVTRFAPSPTGFLHIGGARTALFNWLYARHHGGIFRLRIEDTDRERSTEAAIAAILQGLDWLGLHHDAEVVHQFARAPRHRAVADELLAAGKAYRCYASAAELDAMRAAQKEAGQPIRYDGRWRDRDPAEAPAGAPFVVRIKAAQTGETIIADQVQGDVRFANAVLDDFVLLRSDGTPTYMLSVVVDDHDMGITHVIRGDDHLTNAARQRQIIDAMGWPVPVYAHLPMLHGEDGAKLSKRHGALGIHEYEALGYLPEAMRNYLLRLGWSHGDDEVISTEQAIAWFNLENVGRSPARVDLKKLESLNAHYMREADDTRLADIVLGLRAQAGETPASEAARAMLIRAMPGLKARARTLTELRESAGFLFAVRPITLEPKADALLNPTARERLGALRDTLASSDWNAESLEAAVRAFVEREGIKLGDIAQPLRAALTGRMTSPPVFDVLAVLGPEEALARIDDRRLPSE
ncbi:MAG: glutamate--tRNA ligase [Alphaproteobacteria bacterium]|nr:glutamate--tRNA ligase [Alphaproteobacteria bacterium]